MEARARKVVWDACREQSLRCLLVVLEQSYVEVGVCFVVSFLFSVWLLRPAAEEGPEPRRAGGECARPQPQERRPVTESSDVLERGGRRSWQTASHADLHVDLLHADLHVLERGVCRSWQTASHADLQAAASHGARSWTPAVAGRRSGHGQRKKEATARPSRKATVRTEKKLGGLREFCCEEFELRPQPFPPHAPSMAASSARSASEHTSSGARFYGHIVQKRWAEEAEEAQRQRMEALAESELRSHARALDRPHFSRSQKLPTADTSGRKRVRFACSESMLVLPNPFSLNAVNSD